MIIAALIDTIKQFTPEPHRIIPSCQIASASQNRNWCLDAQKGEIFVMMDDDISGFYTGWLSELVTSLVQDRDCIVMSARLLGADGKEGPMMGGDSNRDGDIVFAYRGLVPTACVAVRQNTVRFAV